MTSLAQVCYSAGDYQQATMWQEKSHAIIKKIASEDNPMLKESQQKLDVFLKLSIQSERNKVARQPGTNPK